MSSSPSPNTSVNEIFPKRKASTVFKDSDSDEETNDEVRLWEAGFKDRYYESKFQVSLTNLKFRQAVAHEYVRGLCWVLRYYYQGCASWSWYFPYHYAPFASDFINIGDLSTEFEKNTKPFEPLEQLMGVFPAASRSHVPEPWGKLMYDPESPIIDFYPEDFQIDLNGKKFAWQGVALLPFVDEVRLKQVLANYYKDLTEEELRRNQRGDDRLYVRRGYAGYDFLVGLYENQMSPNAEITHDAKTFHGMGGTVLLAKEVVPFEGELRSPIKGLHDIFENQVTCVRFRDPKYKDDYIFPAVRLPNAIDPPKVLRPKNLTEEEARNWRPQIGMGPRTTKATLDISGHRALAHAGYPPRGERDNRYSNVPPPIAGSNNARSYN
jgi:5'-3' exoribonuclease 2